MNPSRRDLTRLLALGSAAAVIGVPIVLVASTWNPLEPVPRGNELELEAESGEPEDAPVQEPRERNRRDRQDRDRDDATPRVNPAQ